MKRKIFNLLLTIAAIFIFLFSATWIYYRQKKMPKLKFLPSIVAVKKSLIVQWVPVHWEKNEFTDRSAMYIPVYLDTIRKPFWMQFDLGSSISYLYNISGSFPYLKEKENKLTVEKNISNNTFGYSGLKVRLADSLFYQAEQIPILNQQAGTFSETDSLYDFKIGDIGYDFIKDRILIIDYRQSRIGITDSLYGEFEKNIKWVTNVFVNQMPIYLPITIDRKKKFMIYDNGSSAFTLWTTVDQWNSWREQKAKPDTFTGYSWGVKENYLRANPAIKINFLGNDVSNLPIWGINKGTTRKPTFLQSIKSFTDKYFGKIINGCIGNEYFRNEVIIFDTKQNRFGIQLKNNE